MDNYNLSFYTDLHSTDGLSYQPDVTWCDNGDAGLSNNIYSWLRSEMAPDLKEYLESMGHFPGPCYFANDAFDPTAGSYPYYSDGPDYSGNYADHRQIPAYLLEIQSLKPNKQRVLGAYNFLHGILQIIVEKADSLQEAIDADVAARVDPVPIAWDYDDPAPTMEWPVSSSVYMFMFIWYAATLTFLFVLALCLVSYLTGLSRKILRSIFPKSFGRTRPLLLPLRRASGPLH